MAVQYKWADKIMVSSYKKETAYATAFPTYTATNYHTLQEATLTIGYDDTARPAGMGAGVEFPGEQYVVRKDVRMTLQIDNLRPHDAGWLAAYALGSSAEAQDGAVAAYVHTHTLASAAALPSFTILATEAGEQNTYTGCVIDTLTFSGDGTYLQATAEIIGSGWRTQDTQTYPATISETPFRDNETRIWMETGAAVDITAWASTDGTATLVAGTPSIVLTNVVYGGWSVTISNNLREQQGYLVPHNAATDSFCRGALDRGAQREVKASLSGVAFEDDAYEDFFIGASGTSAHMALEINCWAQEDGVVAGGGAIYHQFAVILPRCFLSPMGSAGDDDGIITRDLELTMGSPTSADEGSAVPITVVTHSACTEFAG